ncbi:MAG TPA: hypothetical protein VEY87_14340 [Gaiellaceae bacterium]|nr:hypothetical protein [Gaiellaceae bacterium]
MSCDSRHVRRVLALALAALLLGAAPAAAIDRPAATAMAQQGTLKIVSRALLDDRGGDLKGTWLNARQACSATRRLRASYEIDLVLPNGTTIRRRPAAKTGTIQNCAEGGPNFGFAVRARRLGMACPNGNWRPGRYSMGIRTLDLRSGIAAHAHLYHQVTRC